MQNSGDHASKTVPFILCINSKRSIASNRRLLRRVGGQCLSQEAPIGLYGRRRQALTTVNGNATHTSISPHFLSPCMDPFLRLDTALTSEAGVVPFVYVSCDGDIGIRSKLYCCNKYRRLATATVLG
jgi:hypothetical protein